MSDLALLAGMVDRFAAEREWDPFHTPKNLASALVVEAAELLECFQWLTPEESSAMEPDQLIGVGEEMADVLIYLVRLAAVLDIDLLDFAFAKLTINAANYPADQVRGKAGRP